VGEGIIKGLFGPLLLLAETNVDFGKILDFFNTGIEPLLVESGNLLLPVLLLLKLCVSRISLELATSIICKRIMPVAINDKYYISPHK